MFNLYTFVMKIIIIGGVAAGSKAAAKAKRILGESSDITIYTDDTHVSYSSCGIPYYIEGNFEDYETLIVRTPEEFEKNGIKVRIKHRVTKIMPESKQVLIFDMENNNSFLESYDKLIIATGARPIVPPVKNTSKQKIFTVRKIEDAIEIKEKLKSSKSAVIVGGGYIGLEMLEAFVKNNVFTTIIERSPHLMSVLDEDMSDEIMTRLGSINKGRFKILTNESVISFEDDIDGQVLTTTETGLKIPADLVIICVGVHPNVEIAVDAGIKLGKTGAIKVNSRMETSIPDIYACGDCVEENLIITNTPVWMPLGSNANKEGRCAAINSSGGFDEFHGVLGSAVTRCLKVTVSMTGLTEKSAKVLGIETITATVTKSDKVSYMPDAKNITLKLVADKKTGKLLGGQAVGSGDTDKRINTLATALLAGLTAKEFANNDITYAPPFSPTIDPLLNAAQILISKLEKDSEPAPRP